MPGLRDAAVKAPVTGDAPSVTVTSTTCTPEHTFTVVLFVAPPGH